MGQEGATWYSRAKAFPAKTKARAKALSGGRREGEGDMTSMG